MKKEVDSKESLISRIFKEALSGDTSILDSIDIDEIQEVEAKKFYLALRTELKKMVAERKKFLKKHFLLKPLSDNDASKVEKILIERFKEKGYGDDVMHRTRKLWQDFVKVANPGIKNPKPWIASLDFIVSNSTPTKFDNRNRVTQKLIAQEYELSFSQINQCYRKIANSVEIDLYFSNIDNIETLYWLMKSIFKIAKRFRKPRDPIETEMIKADEAWFDNIYEYASALQSRRNLNRQ